MFPMRRLGITPILFYLFVSIAAADVTNCKCDPAKPETLESRECSLCREAEKQPVDAPYFFLKDANPRKPNRLLLLPRKHYEVGHSLDDMSRKEYVELWTAAIAKSKALWGDEWGLAHNGELVRTQCHGHIHIGKLLKGVEEGKPMTIQSASQIPWPRGKGLWIHPIGKTSMHVHTGEQICETVLLR